MTERILVQVDKTVVKVTGVSVSGLDTRQLEKLLRDALGNMVRVIGVTGESVSLDVYGLDAEAVLRAGDGIITAVSLADGITAEDVIRLDSVQSIRNVPIDAVPEHRPGQCLKERWL